MLENDLDSSYDEEENSEEVINEEERRKQLYENPEFVKFAEQISEAKFEDVLKDLDALDKAVKYYDFISTFATQQNVSFEKAFDFLTSEKSQREQEVNEVEEDKKEDEVEDVRKKYDPNFIKLVEYLEDEDFEDVVDDEYTMKNHEQTYNDLLKYAKKNNLSFDEAMKSIIDDMNKEKKEKEKDEFLNVEFDNEAYLDEELKAEAQKLYQHVGGYEMLEYFTPSKKEKTDIYKIFNSENRDFSKVIAKDTYAVFMNFLHDYNYDVLSSYLNSYVTTLTLASKDTEKGILSEKEIKDNYLNGKKEIVSALASKLSDGKIVSFDAEVDSVVKNRNPKNIDKKTRNSLISKFSTKLDESLEKSNNLETVVLDTRQRYKALTSLVYNQSIWKKIFHPFVYASEKRTLNDFKNKFDQKFNVTENTFNAFFEKNDFTLSTNFSYNMIYDLTSNLELHLDTNCNNLIDHLKKEKLFSVAKEVGELKADKDLDLSNAKDVQKEKVEVKDKTK